MTIETGIIRLLEAERAGCAPRLLLGRLHNGELCYAVASNVDMRDRFWSRAHDESAEAFEDRIVSDLRDRSAPTMIAAGPSSRTTKRLERLEDIDVRIPLARTK